LAQESYKPGAIFRDTLKDGSTGPEMIVIPAGTFQMGDIHGMRDKSEKPVHTVRIRNPFALGRYQVTFGEYDYYANLTGRKFPDDEGWGRDRRPIINVSWHDAKDYAAWLAEQTGKHYRLPTEAEWEYAARSGGKDEVWAGTSDEEQLADYAVFAKDRTEPVGSRKPNGLGLHDMTGNLWEWVEDCWHGNYNGAPENGSAWLEASGGDCGQRRVRGGSWNSTPEFLRVSYRTRGVANVRYNNFGFRLALDLE